MPPRTSRFFACGTLAEWEGRQEGYALGLQEIDKLAWEIVDFLKNYSPEKLAINRMPQAAIVELENWLLSKGIRRMEEKV